MIDLPFLNRKKKNPDIKPVVLVVLDGFGVAPPSEGNAISLAKTPNIDSFLKEYPNTTLIASGESVGLPANEVGNTEVGHLTLGAGRTMYQDLKRIDISIEKGFFYDNKAFLKAAAHVKKNGSKMHLMGLVGSGHVHSSVEHLYALLQFCKKEDINQVYLHLFTDGRDSPPQQGVDILQDIQERLKNLRLGKIATLSGRYYAMDRDRRWQRTKKAYDAIVSGKGITADDPVSAVKQSYQSGKTDEFVEPTVITQGGSPVATLDDNDAAVFFNFRIDRPRQLTMAIVMDNFENLKTFDFGYDKEKYREEGKVEISQTFKRGKVVKNLYFVTMTEYAKDMPVSAIAFGPEVVQSPLPEVISQAGRNQMHMAESEKERFVTYYFDGMRESKFDGEDTKIVPSPKVATYDKKPEMSLPKLVDEFIKQLYKDKYHFFVINFANPDMVAHSGNIEATIQAIEHVDHHLNRLVSEARSVGGTVLVTADHGNSEELLSFPNQAYFITTSEGDVNTDHSNNPVPLMIISDAFKGSKASIPKGSLIDVAPTVLSLMGIEVPEQMNGSNLLHDLKSDETSEFSNQEDESKKNIESDNSTSDNKRYIPPQYE